jgi:hypothetical protein
MMAPALMTAALTLLCATAGATPQKSITVPVNKIVVGHLQELNLEQVRSSSLRPQNLPAG